MQRLPLLNDTLVSASNRDLKSAIELGDLSLEPVVLARAGGAEDPRHEHPQRDVGEREADDRARLAEVRWAVSCQQSAADHHRNRHGPAQDAIAPARPCVSDQLAVERRDFVSK